MLGTGCLSKPSRAFQAQLRFLRELRVYFESENMSHTNALSRAQRCTTSTGGIEHKGCRVTEHSKEMPQYWLGFCRHVDRAICRSCIRIADTRDDLSISS